MQNYTVRLTWQVQPRLKMTTYIDRVFKHVGHAFSTPASPGTNRVGIPLAIRKRVKRAGTYRITALATDAAGNASGRRQASFRLH